MIFSMWFVYLGDLQRSVSFYKKLGLNVRPAPQPFGEGIRSIVTTDPD